MAATSNGTTVTDLHISMDPIVPSNQTYATVGSLAVLLWDIFLHIPQDYKLATKSWKQYRVAKLATKSWKQHRAAFFFVIYWIARLASLVYVLGVAIISTAEVEQCDHFRLVAIMYPFAMPLTVLPFVVRVFALYQDKRFYKYIVGFFSLSWLLVLGTCVMMPIGVISIAIGSRRYCLQNKLLSKPELRIFLLIHDSFIFLATSWALMRNSYDTLGAKKGIRSMLLSRHLFPFSKSILRDGQAYYLVVLIFTLVYLVLPYSLPQVRTQCTISLVLISNMSSHVYRNMRLGLYKDYTISTSAIRRAVEVPSEIVQQHPEMTPSTRRPDDGGDLEAGDIRRAEEEVEEFEVMPGERDKTEKT